MLSGATLNATSASASPSRIAASPIVLIDGQIHLGLSVLEIERRGPLDERSATIVVNAHDAEPTGQPASHFRQLAGRAITIASPIALDSGTNRLRVELSGRINRTRLDAQQSDRVVIVDDWSVELDTPTPSELASVNTVGAALASIGVLTGLLTSSVLNAAIPDSLRRAPTRRDLLLGLCEVFGLVVDRQPRTERGRVVDHRGVRCIRNGRRVALSRPDTAHPIGEIISATSSAEPARPVRLTARAGGAVVESTFDLQPGWADAPTELDDSAYARPTSSDFSTVSSVFRPWVLNEDGKFAGPRFDPTDLFDDGRPIPRQPIPFAPALTHDASGQSVGVSVEHSTDDGESWHTTTGRVVVLRNRAGVYLDDDTLDPSWLDAVRLGAARVRVTASLVNPLPLTTVRWLGNPFHGRFSDQTIAMGDRFAHRFVHPLSRFHEAVTSGARDADTIDQRSNMATWLALRSLDAPAVRGQASFTLAGTNHDIRMGDRIDGYVASAAERLPEDWDDGLVVVWRTRRRFDRDTTELSCELR